MVSFDQGWKFHDLGALGAAVNNRAIEKRL
jgi:hypothetical protein